MDQDIGLSVLLKYTQVVTMFGNGRPDDVSGYPRASGIYVSFVSSSASECIRT